MADYLIRGMAMNNQIRFFAAYTKDTVEKAHEIHNTYPVVTAALGRLLTAGSLMGSMCKNDTDVVTLQISGDGPIKNITVTSDATAYVKGIAGKTDIDLPPNEIGKLDVGGAVGHGILSVIKDIGLKEPYVGQTELVSGEIAEDLTYYFAVSDQIPSSVALGVLVDTDGSVKQAGGFIIQLMPFAEESTIETLENNLKDFKSITTYLDNGDSIEDIINNIFKDFDVEITDKIDIGYKCNCSRDRVKKALISIGKKELCKMIADDEPVTLNCQFCNTNYTFEVDELQDILLNN